VIGHVFSQTFRLFFARFHRYALLAAALNLPDLALNFYIQPALLEMSRNGPVPSGQLGRYFALIGVSLLVTIVVSTYCQAVLCFGAWHELRGRSIGFRAMLGRGLSRWLVAIAFTLVLYALVVIGAVFLVFPAIIFMVMTFVGLPACVIEHGGPFRGLTRSIDLTEGYRWKVFVILLAVLVATVGGAFAAQTLLGRATVAFLIVQFIWQSLAIALGAILSVATYLNLRIAKEGGDIERFAAVFD